MGTHKHMKRYGLILLTSALLLLYLGGQSLPDLSGTTPPPPRPIFGQRSLKKSGQDYHEPQEGLAELTTEQQHYGSINNYIQSVNKPKQKYPTINDVKKYMNSNYTVLVKQKGSQKIADKRQTSINYKRKDVPLKSASPPDYKPLKDVKAQEPSQVPPRENVPYHEILKTQPKSLPRSMPSVSRNAVAANRSNSILAAKQKIATSKKPKKPDSLFTFKDMKSLGPGHNMSRPLAYALSTAKSYLNYEFSEKKFPFIPVPRPGATFRPETANKMDIVGNKPVGTTLKPSEARHILIATTWRSGSSFFGSLLNSYPGAFYYFEPLHYYSRKNNASLLESQDKMDFLKSLFSCQFNTQNLGFLHHVAQPANRFLFKNHNTRMWKACTRILPSEVFCFLPDFMNSVCPLYPIKLMKTVRLRVDETRKLLEDSELNLKVLHLVRDPRGVFASRREKAIQEWCKQDDCAKPENNCANLIKDLEAARQLEADFPGQMLVIRYEDLSLNPVQMVKSILEFLDLPERKEIMDYVDSHTSRDKPQIARNKKTKKVEIVNNPYALARNSSATAFKWRQTMPWQDIVDIQQTCSEAMDIFGYSPLADESETRSDQLPFQKSPNDLWPSPVWQKKK